MGHRQWHANEASRPARDAGRRSENRTATKELFRAAKSIVRRIKQAAPQPPKRKGDSGKAFIKASRKITRRVFVLPTAACVAVVIDTFELLNLCCNDEWNYDSNDYDAAASSDYLYPHL